MFERKVDFVKIYAKQNGMSVKEYKAYMQERIEDMKRTLKQRIGSMLCLEIRHLVLIAIFKSVQRQQKNGQNAIYDWVKVENMLIL